MLITFNTDAHESITFFGDVALKLLTLMGQTPLVPGAILAKDVSKALNLLKKAIEGGQGSGMQSDFTDEQVISLKHRALPLIGLLQAAADKHCDVLWS